MSYGLFLSVFIVAVLALIVMIYLLVKIKKYGKKPAIISVAVFVVLLIIVIPLGNKPLTGDYKKEASTFTYNRYLNGDIPEGTIVKIEGQVLSLNGSEVGKGDVFLLDGEDGTFYVKNNNVEDVKVKDGEIITVYGGFSGIGESNSPSVNAQVIEK